MPFMVSHLGEEEGEGNSTIAISSPSVGGFLMVEEDFAQKGR